MQNLQRKVERDKLLLLRDLPDLSVQILDLIEDRGRISIGEAVILTETNHNTLKPHFKNLLKKELIELHGGGRGAWRSLL